MAKKNTLKSDRLDGLAKDLGKQDPFDSLQQEAYLNLVRTHEQLASQFAQLFKQFGISDPQYNALRILQGEDRPMQIYQIAERMVSPQTDISRLIDRMQAAGLVTREKCGADRRVVWIQPDGHSQETVAETGRSVRQLHDSQFSNLNVTQLKQLNQLTLPGSRLSGLNDPNGAATTEMEKEMSEVQRLENELNEMILGGQALEAFENSTLRTW